MQAFYKIFFFLVVFAFYSGCVTDEHLDKTDQAQNLPSTFSDVLDYKGVPDSTTDRSVFMFSDLGAWNGFALPNDNAKDYYGSFIGPFTMMQDNGVWMSDCLAKLSIASGEKLKSISFEDAQLIENSSYPNQLKQVFEFTEPQLEVQSDLVFVSKRTALIKVIIKNKSDTIQKVQVRWNGDSFLDNLKFSTQLERNIVLTFGESQKIGRIRTSDDRNTKYGTGPNSYQIYQKHQFLKPGDQLESHLTQSICFTKEEDEQETKIAKATLQNPDKAFQKNQQIWNQKIEKVLSTLRPEFQDEAHQRMAIKCLQTLNNNWRSAAGFLEHDGLFPSYNYEWFNGFWSWDSWKHAVAIAKYDETLAKNQIRAMYDFQDEMGMIADCVYRDTIIENHNWRDTKPPLSGWSIWEVYQQSQDKAFLKEMLPKLEKYHQWWYEYRDLDQNGWCEYGSTDGSLIAAKWESGMDNAVRFDQTKMIENGKQGGSMNRESVDLNAYLCEEKRYLSLITKELSLSAKSDQYQEEYSKLKENIQTAFWNEEMGWFCDLSLETKEPLQIYGAEGWIPLWTNLAKPEQAAAVAQTMLDTTKFATYIPFPTLAADHPKFKPNRGYWRGPVWLDQAYFAITALRNYGYDDEALQFSKNLFDRLEGLKNADGPIRENYHPHTGEGMESKHFSWSAAHLMMLLTE